MKFIKYQVLLFILMLSSEMQAQNSTTFNNRDEYYIRVLQISGISDDDASYHLRPYEFSGPIENFHPWEHVIKPNGEPLFSLSEHAGFDLFEPVLFQSYNTALPHGTNDGPVWQGKGYNMAFTAGAGASFGPLHIRLRPVVGMAQNRSFDLGPYQPPQIKTDSYNYLGPSSEYAYRDFRGSIDYVQRYGDETYSWFDLGDSSIELRYSGFKVALSNRQVWTGPAVNTSLHFGYSAPGFRHIYAGTYRPVRTAAGSFEFAYIFGGMRESDYFSIGRNIGTQSVNSLVFIYKPWFTNRFTLGAIRTYFHPYPESFSEYKTQAKKLFEPGLRNAISDDGVPRGAHPDNQLGSVFFRYVISDYGVEFYAEYGRNDHNADWRDFRAQPNHHRAYTIGATKTFSLSNQRLLAVNLELNQLEAMRTALTRGDRHLGGWYTHSGQVLGFTNKGQITGTGFGPGMNMQMLRADIFDEKGSVSFKLARITYHNSRLDQYFEQIQAANNRTVERWEVRNSEILLGAEVTAFLIHGLELSAVLDQSFIFNRHYLRDNNVANTRLEVVLRKQMRGWRR